jgi:site-specific recombinase XerD
VGLVSSLRVPSKQYQCKKDIEKSSRDVDKHRIHTIGYQFEMRDLYNRKSRLKYWIKKIHTDLDDENDKMDVLKFVEIMQEKDQSILTIIKGISVILQLRKQLKKPFSQVTKEDITLLFKWMDEKGYKVETHEKFRAVLKKFYKMIYGNSEFHPDNVRWFSIRVGKDKKSQERQLDINEYLEEEEIRRLVEATSNVQKKAFLACLYETGARPEEFLRLI